MKNGACGKGMVIGMERNGRIPEVMDRMQPVMEAYFREACIFFQQTVDCSGDKIWENVKSAVGEALQKAVSLQKEGRKGKLQYLCFSFMEYGSLLDRPEIRIDALDEGFYLDEQEAAAEFVPDFWQERYREDIHRLDKEIGKAFIRVQNYERMEMRKVYMGYYYLALFGMLQSMAERIMETVQESGVGITGRFMMLGGKYMDEGVLLCERREEAAYEQ